jgi:LPS sulfotransferase NodH
MSLFLPALPLGLPAYHAQRIREHLGSGMEQPGRLPADVHFVFLCFTNRSGSNYLANLLSSTGQLNKADEVFNHDRVIEACRVHKLPSLHAYLAHVARETAVNSALLTKLAIDQLVMLVECGLLDRIIGRSRFIVMERLDKLGQAISLAIAEQNGRWAWYLPAKRADEELRFSRERVIELLDSITLQHCGFDRFFAWNSITPVVAHYESLVADPQALVAAIGAQLGFGALRIDETRLELQPQATAMNRSWRKRFLAELAAR